MNYFKTFLLMLGLSALMLFIGEMAGGKSGLIMGLGFALFSNIFSYYFSDKIVLALYRAKPADEGQFAQLHQVVNELAQKAGIPKPRIYVIPGPMANAFATGRNPKHAAVAVTEGILQILSPRQLRGVLAHEISHVLHRDILISTIAAVMAGAIYTIARIAQWSMMFAGHRDNERQNPIGLLVVALVAPLAAMLIQMAVSRSREYEADKGGSALSQDPLSLAEALKKIHDAAKATRWQPNPTTAHLFISNPLRAENMMALFSTHPPTSERVKRLEKMAQGTVMVAAPYRF